MFPFMLVSLEDRGDRAMVRGDLEPLVGEGNVHEQNCHNYLLPFGLFAANIHCRGNKS